MDMPDRILGPKMAAMLELLGIILLAGIACISIFFLADTRSAHGEHTAMAAAIGRLDAHMADQCNDLRQEIREIRREANFHHVVLAEWMRQLGVNIPRHRPAPKPDPSPGP